MGAVADSGSNATDINNRIARAIAWAAALTDARLRASPYRGHLPIADDAGAVPLLIVDVNVKLAGYWLSTSRGTKDYDKDGNPITQYISDYRDALDVLERIVDGKLDLGIVKG
jgi:phage gp36-like protein